MKRIVQLMIMLGFLPLLSGCSGRGAETEQKLVDQQGQQVLDLPQPETESILSGEQVLDLGNHMVAYYEPREQIDTDFTWQLRETFAGERYIAIYDLDRDVVWYLPDVYGKLLEIRVEESLGVSLRYVPDAGEDAREVCVPVYFYERDEDKALDFAPYASDRKAVFGSQEGLEAGADSHAWEVWEETFSVGEDEYTVLFERVSPIYDPGYECGGVLADYCLSVQDGEGHTLCRQMIVHYPVAYEEAYWLIDFSGDGFPDVAFCTDVYRGGKNGSWSSLRMLIWDADTGRYVEREVGSADDLPVWNVDMASLVVCSDTRDRIYCAKDMFAWLDGKWQKTRRLERVYSETEFYDMPGVGEIPCFDGYRELIYSDGEVIQENRIAEDFYENNAFWFEEECIWSDNYKGSVKLYPDWPEWEVVETETGGMTIDKYIRANSEME